MVNLLTLRKRGNRLVALRIPAACVLFDNDQFAL